MLNDYEFTTHEIQRIRSVVSVVVMVLVLLESLVSGGCVYWLLGVRVAIESRSVSVV